ncbi:MAG: enoyl-CoA hydratase/isomerase family protein [Cytophagales bacterium]|nr:MAG: enoyl-CoA hydratase/isomerase family protein [Cytophagales bacterium]
MTTNTTFQEIIINEPLEGVCEIRLNRPNVLNALTPLMLKELAQITQQIAKGNKYKIVIVRGEGRAFSAGIDLKAMNQSIEGGQFSADAILQDGTNFLNQLRSMPQVAIAAVNGYCFTGATELMLGFDLIIAAEEAQIGDTHAKWGIAPKWGMTQRLPRMVGILKAKELSFTAQAVSGKEAERIGLVNKAVPLEKLDEAVQEMCLKILANSAQTIAAMKQLYNQSLELNLSGGLQYEQDRRFEITDRQEFLRDFENKK